MWRKISRFTYGEIKYNKYDMCSRCQNQNFNLVRITRWFTLFFIPLIPYKIQYFKICKNCNTKFEIDNIDAEEIISTNFQHIIREKKLSRKVIVISIILSFIFLVAFDETDYKDLVDIDKGQYFNIYDSDSNYKASIEYTNNTKKYTRYLEVSPYAEEGSSNFTSYDYFYDNEKDELVYHEDTAAVIVDRFGMNVRHYWYDTEEDALYWDNGVSDLDSIEYTENGAIYNTEYYYEDDEVEYYLIKLQRNDKYEVITTFFQGINNTEKDRELVQITINIIDNYRFSEQNIYYEIIDEINLESSIDDIMSLISKKGIKPDIITEYTYYKNTRIPLTIKYSQKENETGEYITEFDEYQVYERDNYYIQYKGIRKYQL